MSDKPITITGVDEVKAKLKQLEQRATKLRPVLLEVANSLKNTSERSFQKQQSPDGKRWKTLAPATLLSSYGKKRATTSRGKATKGFTRYAEKRKILVKSGMLSASIKARATNQSASLSINLPYAAIHHFGGKAGRGRRVTIPARPYLPIDNDGKLNKNEVENVLEILENYLKKRG